MQNNHALIHFISTKFIDIIEFFITYLTDSAFFSVSVFDGVLETNDLFAS